MVGFTDKIKKGQQRLEEGRERRAKQRAQLYSTIKKLDNTTKDMEATLEISQQVREQAPGWGGAREGSGRPALPQDEKFKRIFFSLKPAYVQRLQEHQQDGESLNQAAKRLLMEILGE